MGDTICLVLSEVPDIQEDCQQYTKLMFGYWPYCYTIDYC